MLWADLRLRRPRNPGRYFNSFLQKHQGIRSLVIDDTSDFLLTGPKLNSIVYGLPQLKRLCLGSQRRYPAEQPFGFGIEGRAGANLTQLSLVSFSNHVVVGQILKLSCDTLEVLDLIDTFSRASDIIGCLSLPRLKKLRLTGSEAEPRSPPSELSLVRPSVLAPEFLRGWPALTFPETDRSCHSECREGLSRSLRNRVAAHFDPRPWHRAGCLATSEPHCARDRHGLELAESRKPSVGFPLLSSLD